jgi:hypothetical protein
MFRIMARSDSAIARMATNGVLSGTECDHDVDRVARYVRRPNDNVNARVRIVVDAHFDGNVAKAARVLGMSQRGLAKLYRGDVRNPQLQSMLALVRGLMSYEDPLWILTGRTAQPTYQPRVPLPSNDASGRESTRPLTDHGERVADAGSQTTSVTPAPTPVAGAAVAAQACRRSVDPSAFGDIWGDD